MQKLSEDFAHLLCDLQNIIPRVPCPLLYILSTVLRRVMIRKQHRVLRSLPLRDFNLNKHKTEQQESIRLGMIQCLYLGAGKSMFSLCSTTKMVLAEPQIPCQIKARYFLWALPFLNLVILYCSYNEVDDCENHEMSLAN